MRKSVIDPVTIHPEQRSEQEWLELEQIAKVEVTSEDPNFPIESALAYGKGPGWRAARGVYFRDPGGHLLELLTKDYSAETMPK
jgi:catechol 2,3-dioxygenase-like lactoylglutathione lyase family enzyme